VRFEKRHQPILTFDRFILRMLRYALVSAAIIFLSLMVGVLGYRHFAGLGWVDSFLNASFILTGMGPVDPMRTDAAKIFASLYALFSGVIFLSAAAVLLSPVAHRVLHFCHVEET
jgi:hypothetical protein